MERLCKTLYTSNKNQAPTKMDDGQLSMQLSGKKNQRIAWNIRNISRACTRTSIYVWEENIDV